MTPGDGPSDGDLGDGSVPAPVPSAPAAPSRRERLREAAIQAEYATGRQEANEEQARRGVIRRVGTIIVGFVVLFGGLAMMVLPGPGVLGVIAGLAILAQELAWAERLLEYVKKRAKIDELKEQPRWVQAVMWTITAGAVVGSVTYFTVIR
ncbi:PGPGW domain-containing protein [Aquihabitans sp. G128]|uniref:PGPGW domain-containing protein n=1 Tax=Aquihabitans sp. G128 TaxID=2849779 RepID=UPI001C236CEC|nr:PGPGW domain-containing protein [Aquihabitans sp. G128]QXC62602.1 PGPGW domain-containing protein [Aquihabitans sp. G128]